MQEGEDVENLSNVQTLEMKAVIGSADPDARWFKKKNSTFMGVAGILLQMIKPVLSRKTHLKKPSRS